MNIILNLELDEGPLKCNNCVSEDFRAVKFIHYDNQAPNYYSMVINPHPVGEPTSQTSIPLAICLKCKRLVSLL